MQSSTPLQVPEQFSSSFGMGAPLNVFSVSGINRWGSAVTGVILLGGAGLVVIYGLYDAYVQTNQYGPAVLIRSITAPFIIAAFMLLFGVLAVVNAYRNWNKAAVVYENGLAYNDNGGLQTWNWQEVDRFFISITKHYSNGVYTGTTYIYTLQKADGSKLKLDNKFKQIEALGKIVGQKVAPFQYNNLVQQLKLGQTVSLGPVSINNDGIAINKKTFAWSEVEQVGIQRGYINVKKKDGGWFSGATAAVASIPNLDALFAVIDQIVKIKAG